MGFSGKGKLRRKGADRVVRPYRVMLPRKTRENTLRFAPYLLRLL